MTKLKEYQIDPTTGAYVGDTPGVDAPIAAPTDYTGGEEMAYVDPAEYMDPADCAPVDTVAVAEPVVQEQPPCANVAIQAIQIGAENEYEIALDITLAVEAVHATSGAVLDTGILTKRVRIRKDALAAELLSRSQSSAVIAESVVETVKEQKLDEAAIQLQEEKRKAAVKRARELAGLPAKGTWV